MLYIDIYIYINNNIYAGLCLGIYLYILSYISFIFKNKPISEGNLFSTTLKPDVGKLEHNFDKISFYAKNGFYNKHSIDKNGNIKDSFGNIVAQSDNLRGNDDKMIDNRCNISSYSDNGYKVIIFHYFF